MAPGGRKRLLWSLTGAVVAVAALLVSLPFIASTRIVADRISAELTATTGFQVSLGGAPEFDVWPDFSARLPLLTLRPAATETASPTLTAEAATLTLDAWSALAGHVRIRAVDLLRPRLTFPAGARPDAGTLPFAARVTRAVAAQRDGRPLPGGGGLPATIRIREGRIEVDGAAEGAVTSLEAQFAWSRLDQPARLRASAIWHGEPVRLEIDAGDGLALLAGQRSTLTVTAEATPARLTFAGSAELTGPPVLEGQVTLAAGSLANALDWIGGPRLAMLPPGEFALAADLEGADRRLKFNGARLTLGGKSGTGVIEATIDPARPAVGGTLAFRELNLTPFVPAATAGSLRAASVMPAVETGLFWPFSVDLRLSADTATLGPIGLSQAAATITIGPSVAAFDLSDSLALGGTIQVGFRALREAGSGRAEVAMHATSIDTNLLADALGLGRYRPSGKATMTAMLKGPLGDWSEMFAHGDGNLSIKLGAGSISDLDYNAFATRARNGGFFGLSEISAGALPVTEAELRASFHDGLALVDRCEIRSPLATISLSGIVPLPDRGLALSGSAAGADGGPPFDFFVGGSWNAPFFSLSSAPSTTSATP